MANIEDARFDTGDIYNKLSDWQKDLDKADGYAKEFSKYKGKLSDPDMLLKYLKLSSEWGQIEAKLSVYLLLHESCDVMNNKYKEMSGTLTDKAILVSRANSFAPAEYKKFSAKYIKELLSDKRFENYKMFLSDLLRSKDHLLPEEINALLSDSAVLNNGRDLFDVLVSGEMKFDRVKDSKSHSHIFNENYYSAYMRGDDRTLRRNAHYELFGKYGALNGTLAVNYITHVRADAFYARANKFATTMESSLFDINVDRRVYDNLISNVHRLLPTLYRYFDVCKKVTKIRDYSIYDIHAPLVKLPKKKITFEQGLDEARNVTSIFGDEYRQGLEGILSSGHIDVAPRQAKQSGAYEVAVYGITPFVLYNFDGTENYVSTIVHELGHAMHSYFSNKYQPMETADYPIFLAEIASTVNEVLYINYKIDHAKTKREKIYYIQNFIDQIESTIFRQTMFSEFEAYAHELVESGKPISAQVLNNAYEKLDAKYHGPSVKMTDVIKYEWSRIPHFYSSFYVYKYATGLISAINMVENMKKDPSYVSRYITFLSSGGSDYPINILKRAGVDLEGSEPFKVFGKVLGDLVGTLETLTK